MKIVQSLWSKPSLKKTHLNSSDRSIGGWSDRKYYYMSWALSCLQFKEFYEEVELVTDRYGYDLLVNKLELPFTNVQVVLDDLDHYHADLWVLGKIFTYGIQQKPFIHADGDVFIWERFDERFENAHLLCQNIEQGFDFYSKCFAEIKNHFHFIPSTLTNSIKKNNQIIAINAGIIGGRDLDLFHEFSKKGFDLVDTNIDKIQNINIGDFNAIVEQFLFYSMAKEQNKKIEYLLSSVNQSYDGLADLAGAPRRIKYVHPVGNYKRVKQIGELVRFHLQTRHPYHYYKIISLLHTYQI